MGTSPMSSFMDATTGSYNMKTVSTTNLLSSSSNDLPASSAPVNHSKLNGCTNCSNTDYDDDDVSISSSRENKRCINYDGQCDYLIAVHRKFTRQDTYFLSHHKTKPSLFGVPLLIPLHEGVQNKDLYCSVWNQVSRLLSPLPPSSTQNHAEDCDDSLGYDFPFTLRAVKENGQVCALCPWARFCRGCQVPCTDDLLLHGIITSSCSSSSKISHLNTQLKIISINFLLSDSSTPNLSAREVTSLSTVITSSSVYIAIDWGELFKKKPKASIFHLRFHFQTLLLCIYVTKALEKKYLKNTARWRFVDDNKLNQLILTIAWEHLLQKKSWNKLITAHIASQSNLQQRNFSYGNCRLFWWEFWYFLKEFHFTSVVDYRLFI